MSEYRAITITQGSGGFGGPLTVEPKEGKDVFFLLDEIFKGTKSRERHIGATVLVKQLAENGAIGLLSTHDLELCDLEKENNEINWNLILR